MHQVGVDDRVGVAAEEAVDAPPIGVDALARVGHGHAQVERGRTGAGLTPPRREKTAWVTVPLPGRVSSESSANRRVRSFSICSSPETAFLARSPVSTGCYSKHHAPTSWGSDTGPAC